jgi:hypothetical protein
MPDTGLPWEIPYVDPTDLVRDYPQASEDLAEQIADKLQDLDDAVAAAGGLVAVKSALFTGTQTASLGGGANIAVTSLSITHTLADPANKLIIHAYIGAAGNSRELAETGLGVADDGTLIALADADGSRRRATVAGQMLSSTNTQSVTSLAATFVYLPGDTAEHTYTVRAINATDGTRTVFINRGQTDTNNAFTNRATSAFVIQEVKV